MNKHIDSNIIEKWIEKEVNECPLFILERIGELTIRNSVRNAIELNVSYCNDNEFGQRIFDLCKVKGTGPNDYKYKYLATPLGEMMTSIRFIGGDMNKPAIFILHKEFDLKCLEDIKEIGQIILKEYFIFQPQRIRWYSADDEAEFIRNNKSIQGDLVYVAEFIENLKEEALPIHFDVVELKETKDIFWYNDYKETFEEIYKSWPEFVEMAQVESLEYLNELKEKQFLFDIKIEGLWAGIIAIDEGTDYFMNGYYIVEEFLMKSFRGKKYATAVQRHLIEKLKSENNKMLFGTIHQDNIPSLKTAFGVGRKRVGTYLFSDL